MIPEFLAGGAAAQLAGRFGTPVFLYEAETLRRTYRRVRDAFRHQPTRIHFAAVCNPNLALLRILREEGAGLHANTPGDVYCGLRAGFSAQDIVFSGSNLGEDDLRFLGGAGVAVNVDSLDDLERACRLHPGRGFGMRLHFPDAMPESRIGIRPDEIPRAVSLARAKDCRIEALHVYCGTHGVGAKRFEGPLARLAELAVELPAVTCINLGGGFAYDYEKPDEAFPFGELAEAAAAMLANVQARRGGAPLQLRVEPGRALVAGAGVLLTRVRSVKVADGRRYVGTDTTVANLTSQPVHGSHRRVAVVAEGEPHPLPADVCGCTTYSRDVIARAAPLPEVKVGDLLAVLDAGAYGYCMASHFLNRPKPPEVVIDRGTVRLVTRRESFEDLVDRQVDPEGPTDVSTGARTGGL